MLNVPVMLHPTDMLDDKAIAVPEMRVTTLAKLAELKTAVEAFATALAQGQNLWANEQAVAQQLGFHRLTGDCIIGISQSRRADRTDHRKRKYREPTSRSTD